MTLLLMIRQQAIGANAIAGKKPKTGRATTAAAGPTTSGTAPSIGQGGSVTAK